ncbi:hypothetical protein VOLCADRAFT_106499 [Volvox carteri f. nagariensis]|uniref:Uncharacterized protein n=1 Tax=Volvox carteri f. nagariensis TaxID=3068 RepID=D8U7S3_VOLCA|nr:uncharacterized protein VOLCADRAFT_106499 [Volvox carteri f. nagariensis]EFJ44352.1 hypothetical protein VOLCADRAFT_106499 [Volvox carteri f. nagariensis]|eukprot:XP_002954711.1 hypothetical protein VOLCADRAFT_106499 [Volvox carteri f. nagariensis]
MRVLTDLKAMTDGWQKMVKDGTRWKRGEGWYQGTGCTSTLAAGKTGRLTDDFRETKNVGDDDEVGDDGDDEIRGDEDDEVGDDGDDEIREDEDGHVDGIEANGGGGGVGRRGGAGHRGKAGGCLNWRESFGINSLTPLGYKKTSAQHRQPNKSSSGPQ